MIKKSFALAIVASIATLAAAGSQDLCTPGSDAECARFGKYMCCAHIQYNYLGDKQDFYACASRPGIKYTGGKIADNTGFSGTWYCAFATGIQTTLITGAALFTLL